MSLAKISPGDRATLRFHGWLLLTWAVGIGVLSSAFLLYVLHVHSMAVRYLFACTTFYVGGFLFGGWWYVQWWKSRGGPLPQRATPDEEVAFDRMREAEEKKLRWWDGIDWLPDLGAGGDDPISMVLFALGVVILLAIVFCILWMLPALASDALGGYLAELVVEFVIGAVLLRRLSRPKPADEYWAYALRSTWLPGVALTILFAAAGFLMQQADPEARTLLQFLRHL